MTKTARNDLSSSPESEPIDRLLLLVCTYNERENLPTLLDQMHAASPYADILIIDDNSPDGTADWIRERQRAEPRLRLISRSGKLGLGTAIKEGMQYAIDHGYPWMINLDGDLSHDPQVIPTMIDHARQCDVAIGSRYVPGGGLIGCSWRRIWVSRSANTLARWIVGWTISDCSSAYRMYRVSNLKKIRLDQLRESGYGFLEEVLAHLLKEGARVVEVPIVYSERVRGKSKISLKEAYSTLSALMRCSRIVRSD